MTPISHICQLKDNQNTTSKEGKGILELDSARMIEHHYMISKNFKGP